MADLTRADYERRISTLMADRMRLMMEQRQGGGARDLHEVALSRYRSVLRRLDWLPPAEMRAEGIGRNGVCAPSVGA